LALLYSYLSESHLHASGTGYHTIRESAPQNPQGSIPGAMVQIKPRGAILLPQYGDDLIYLLLAQVQQVSAAQNGLNLTAKGAAHAGEGVQQPSVTAA